MRFFSATAMGGRLYVQGISDHSLWDPKQLFYMDESVVDMISYRGTVDRKVQTSNELHTAILLSERGLPTVKVWISEELESVVEKLWEDPGVSKK